MMSKEERRRVGRKGIQKERRKDMKKEKKGRGKREGEEKKMKKSENQRGSAQNGWAGAVNRSRES